MNEKNEEIHNDESFPLDSNILNQLVEQITAVAALDFSKKITNLKGDGSAMDTVALGLNMLCEELEDSVVSRDQLEEKNRELKLVISRMNQFQYALDSSSIVVTTDLKGDIIYLNDKFCEISKYSREELMGQTYNVVDSGHHSIDFWKEMWQTISQGKLWTNEIKERAKDGTHYWVNMTVVPFVGLDQKPYQYMIISRDITAIKELDQRILNSIILAQEKDRELFAEDLHEGIAQSLAALMLQVGIIEMKVKESEDTDLKKSVAFIKNYIQESIENTRSMATELMPRTMMKYGIEPSLRMFVSRLEEHLGGHVEFECSIETPSPIQKDIEITVYRAVVAVLNTMYKTEPTKISIDMKSGNTFSTNLEIQYKEKSKSVALLNFEEQIKRIQLQGGFMSVSNSFLDKVLVKIEFAFNSEV